MTDKDGRLKYANYDPSLGEPPTEEQIEKLQNYKPELPTLTFVGSEKLHGENMAICYSDNELWVQGRNQIRTILGDQNGMAKFVEERKEAILNMTMSFALAHDINTTTHTIVFDCEWAGGNIQRGNAACSGIDKSVYLFDYVRVVCNLSNDTLYVPLGNYSLVEQNIYSMKSFTEYMIPLNFNAPKECEELLQCLAESVEANSPIAKFFDKEDNVGEGIYLYATYNGELLRVKAKGEKHGGKPKVPREPKKALTDEETIRLTALANEITPVWRITQGITETGAKEMKHLGALIGWVIQDIKKEEPEEITSELKSLSRFVSGIVKDYYIDYLKDY